MYDPTTDYTDDTELIDKELNKALLNGIKQQNYSFKKSSIQNWIKKYESVDIEIEKLSKVTFNKKYNCYFFPCDNLILFDTIPNTKYKQYDYDDEQPEQEYFEETYNLGYSIHPIISKITNIIDEKLNKKHSIISSKLKTRNEVLFLHLSYEIMEVIIDNKNIIVIYDTNEKKYFPSLQEFLDYYDIFYQCLTINESLNYDIKDDIIESLNNDMNDDDIFEQCSTMFNDIFGQYSNIDYNIISLYTNDDLDN